MKQMIWSEIQKKFLKVSVAKECGICHTKLKIIKRNNVKEKGSLYEPTENYLICPNGCGETPVLEGERLEGKIRVIDTLKSMYPKDFIPKFKKTGMKVFKNGQSYEQAYLNDMLGYVDSKNNFINLVEWMEI